MIIIMRMKMENEGFEYGVSRRRGYVFKEEKVAANDEDEEDSEESEESHVAIPSNQ
jgi:hypothetical protein